VNITLFTGQFISNVGIFTQKGGADASHLQQLQLVNYPG